MFKKILIANRGEIALRVIRTAHEMGIKTVAVYSTADKESLHVRFADEAVCIGPPTSRDSYLNIPNIISAAEITNADAIHPGYGFLSENARFSKICGDHGIKFIGATPEQIEKMGDKSMAKDTMKQAGVPTIPGSDGLLDSITEAKRVAKKIKYPVIIKATAGGGGRGMRIVWKEEDLENAWDSARQEAAAAFGNDGMYMEKYIEEPRHIEIQVIGDQYGRVVHLSERDCSVQRRHQKLVEETPSPFMTQELRDEMGDAAVKAAKAVNYEGCGTVEFLVDKHRNFYFMEMNTRIQVEHPITEEVIDYDLIREQIKVAAGVPISGKNYYPMMHAIECRINAEHPETFVPSPGLITEFHAPGGPDVRLDSAAYAGYRIPPHYDSLIGKLIVHGRTRRECLMRLKRSLQEMVVGGVHTTLDLHRRLVDNDDVVAGHYNIQWLEKFLADAKAAEAEAAGKG